MLKSICVLQGLSPLAMSANKGGRLISLFFCNQLCREGKERKSLCKLTAGLNYRADPRAQIEWQATSSTPQPLCADFRHIHARARAEREKRRQIDLKFALACESELQRRLAACLLAFQRYLICLTLWCTHSRQAAPTCTHTYIHRCIGAGWGVQIECK